jgi:lipoate-protein ligase A
MGKLAACRLLLESEPHSGAWNMAVDEALLETAVREGLATFRWYRWSEPTLSLGYFQVESEVPNDPKWSRLPVVRRLTGGGAILHDREWTYSFTVPAGATLAAHPVALYDLVHGALIDLIRRYGLAADKRGETPPTVPEPLLCFSRRDAHDVVVCGHKVVGSAQRRRKGAVLQHGSLLLRRPELAPGHLGVEDLGLSGTFSTDELAAIPERWSEAVFAGSLTAAELQRVRAKMDAAPESARS